MCIPLNPLKSSGAEVGLHFIDEPTNDFDIATLTILEDYLDKFEGIVITVSHDRYFLDRTVKRIFAFENGQINQYEGNYSDYILRKEMENGGYEELKNKASKTGKSDNSGKSDTSEANSNVENNKKSWAGRKKLRFSYKEQKEYDTIEEDVANLEEKIKDLDAKMLTVTTDFVKLNEYMAQKEQAEAELEEKMERWMYLEALAERINNGEYEDE